MPIRLQAAAKKRSRRHLLETDEFVSASCEGTLMDVVTLSTAYQKMKNLCLNIRNEIFTDIQIHDHHVLPRWVFYHISHCVTSFFSCMIFDFLCFDLTFCMPRSFR